MADSFKIIVTESHVCRLLPNTFFMIIQINNLNVYISKSEFMFVPSTVPLLFFGHTAHNKVK